MTHNLYANFIYKIVPHVNFNFDIKADYNSPNLFPLPLCSYSEQILCLSYIKFLWLDYKAYLESKDTKSRKYFQSTFWGTDL